MLTSGEFPHALGQDGPTRDVASASAAKRRGRGPSDRIGSNFSPGAKHLRVESLRYRRKQAIERRRRERELAALFGPLPRKSPPPPPPPPPQRRRSSLPSIAAEQDGSSQHPAASHASQLFPSVSSVDAVGAGARPSTAGAIVMSASGGVGEDGLEEEAVTRVIQE